MNQSMRQQKRTRAGNGKQLIYLEWPKINFTADFTQSLEISYPAKLTGRKAIVDMQRWRQLANTDESSSKHACTECFSSV